MRRGRGGVGGGDEGGDDPEGDADVHEPALPIFREDAHAAQTQQRIKRLPADEADQRQLVALDAAVRFLPGQGGQFFGPFRHGPAHGPDDGVKPLLRERRQRLLRGDGVFRRDPRVLDGKQIVVHEHVRTPVSAAIQKPRGCRREFFNILMSL